MRRKLLVTLLALAVLVGAWFIPLTTSTDELPVRVTVTEERVIGAHMTKEEQHELDFGTTFPGAVTTKTLNLTRGNAPPPRVRVTVSGELAPWTAVERPDFKLVEPTEVNVTLAIPRDTEAGDYRGLVTLQYTVTYGSLLLHQLAPE